MDSGFRLRRKVGGGGCASRRRGSASVTGVGIGLRRRCPPSFGGVETGASRRGPGALRGRGGSTGGSGWADAVHEQSESNPALRGHRPGQRQQVLRRGCRPAAPGAGSSRSARVRVEAATGRAKDSRSCGMRLPTGRSACGPARVRADPCRGGVLAPKGNKESEAARRQPCVCVLKSGPCIHKQPGGPRPEAPVTCPDHPRGRPRRLRAAPRADSRGPTRCPPPFCPLPLRASLSPAAAPRRGQPGARAGPATWARPTRTRPPEEEAAPPKPGEPMRRSHAARTRGGAQRGLRSVRRCRARSTA